METAVEVVEGLDDLALAIEIEADNTFKERLRGLRNKLDQIRSSADPAHIVDRNVWFAVHRYMNANGLLIEVPKGLRYFDRVTKGENNYWLSRDWDRQHLLLEMGLFPGSVTPNWSRRCSCTRPRLTSATVLISSVDSRRTTPTRSSIFS
jgi:hypothetical protein